MQNLLAHHENVTKLSYVPTWRRFRYSSVNNLGYIIFVAFSQTSLRFLAFTCKLWTQIWLSHCNAAALLPLRNFKSITTVQWQVFSSPRGYSCWRRHSFQVRLGQSGQVRVGPCILEQHRLARTMRQNVSNLLHEHFWEMYCMCLGEFHGEDQQTLWEHSWKQNDSTPAVCNNTCRIVARTWINFNVTTVPRMLGIFIQTSNAFSQPRGCSCCNVTHFASTSSNQAELKSTLVHLKTDPNTAGKTTIKPSDIQKERSRKAMELKTMLWRSSRKQNDSMRVVCSRLLSCGMSWFVWISKLSLTFLAFAQKLWTQQWTSHCSAAALLLTRGIKTITPLQWQVFS